MTAPEPEARRMRVLEDQAAPGASTALQQRVTEALARGERRVILDMRAAQLGGTTDVSALCVVLRSLAVDGAQLVVAGLPPHVCRVLELCAIDHLELEADPPVL